MIRELPSGQEKDELCALMSEAFTNAGEKMLSLAIDDEIVTEEEVQGWMREYDATRDEVAQLVMPFYVDGLSLESKRDSKYRAIILTIEGSATHRMKGLAEKRFQVGVMTQKEFADDLIMGVIECPPEMLSDVLAERKKRCRSCGTGEELCLPCRDAPPSPPPPGPPPLPPQ
jgi:hypothetical protein